MTRKHFWEQKLYLDYLFELGAKFKENDELLAHWARYLCVLVSGWVQVSVYSIYNDYSQKRSSANVSIFVSKKLKHLQNPTMENILKLTCEFSPEWKKALEDATRGETKAAINSIVANRNLIAHGESSGVSYVPLKDWYEKAVRGIQIIEEQCNA
jgi:hypothetical protein